MLGVLQRLCCEAVLLLSGEESRDLARGDRVWFEMILCAFSSIELW